MAENDRLDDMLEDLFAQAKQDPEAQVSDNFMARMVAQAEDLQPLPNDVAPAVPRRAFLRVVFDALGGWQGASGLVAATMASVWIGFSGAESLSVDGLQAVISGDADYYLSDLSTEFSFDFEEG